MKPLTINKKRIKIGFKNKLHILIFLIFNIFCSHLFAQNQVENKEINTSIRKTDTVIVQSEQLEDILQTNAEESIRNDVDKNMTYLKKNAQVKYMDMKIDADYIIIDRDKFLISAYGEQDSLGRIIKPAMATQAGKTYEYDNFSYNYKTQQAIAYNARTEESEGVIVAQKTKKYNDSVFYMKRGIYTTDQYFLEKKDSLADYHLAASDIKLIKGKNKSQVVTGPIQMYIEQVPTPLIMPFAILPFSDKRSAGILIPSFGERQDVGFFLNNLGYYQPIGEHFDLKIMADYYTKGSWNLRPEMNYIKKYKYSGNFAADIGNTVRGIKGLDDYSKTRTYRISWRHSQDSKANPFFNFSASVDLVSSKFYDNTINNNYIFNQNVLNTQQNSSVSVTKRFLKLPVTITAAANYSQNFATGLSTLRLPEMNVAVNQFYLFKPKTGVRTGLLENINVNTGLRLTNYVNTEEGELFKQEMWDKLQTGATNSIALSTNTTVAKYFTFSLVSTINNAVTTKTITKQYNPVENEINNVTNKGVAGFSTFTSTASLQTTLYGTKIFKKDAKIQGIRHMITPSLSFSYSPDFGDPKYGYYRNYYDPNGNLIPYSIFEGGVVGTPTSGEVGAIGFSIGNNLEMKVKSKKDSTGVKKIKIFESLSFTGGYNFAAKTHPWSPINFNGQSSFFDGKLSLNSNMTLEPYEIIFTEGSDVGIRSENFGKFSISNFGLQMSYPLSNIIFGEPEDLAKSYNKKGEIRNENYYFDDDNYARFQQPWTLNINATYGYTKGYSRFGDNAASVGLDGSVKLTPYWDINGSTHYDFISKELAYTRIGFSRDQRSFTINFNWVPFGRYKVYDFFIGIKANILSDALKYKDRSFPEQNSSF